MSTVVDGRLLTAGDETRLLDRGALLGDGLFETVLVRRGAAPLLGRHVDRLQRSAAKLGCAVPDELFATVREGLATLLDEDGRAERAALRITVSAGGGRGLAPPSTAECVVVLTLSELPDHPAGLPATPARAAFVNAHRVDPAAAVTGHKVLSWLPWILARREALACGADIGIVRSIAGDVAEADHANLFVVRDGVVRTPPLEAGAFPGITRARALAALVEAGWAPSEERLSIDAVLHSDEVFLTSSLDVVRPISSLGGRDFVAPGEVAIWLAACL